MIKFTKFFGSDGLVKTYFNVEQVLSATPASHEFKTGEEAQAHSTSEAFVFFDNVPVGIGMVAEPQETLSANCVPTTSDVMPGDTVPGTTTHTGTMIGSGNVEA